MMFGKALTKSGKKIVKAIKKLSSTRQAKKLQYQLEQQQQKQLQIEQWQEDVALANRLNDELDAKSTGSNFDQSLDGFVAYIAADSFPYEECCVPYCCCRCYCYEHEENQLNENLENEMMIVC